MISIHLELTEQAAVKEKKLYGNKLKTMTRPDQNP